VSVAIKLSAVLALAIALFSVAAEAKPRGPASAGLVQVRLQTDFGLIDVAIDTKHAPITAANFLAYVDAKRFDGITFYRAARAKNGSGNGLVQGGIDRNYPKAFAPIAHEPTTHTGLRHVDGTISMARNDPGTAMGEFFFVVGSAPYLDATKTYPGYAAFGHVVRGMPVIRRVLQSKTYPGGHSKDTMGQTIINRVKIITTRRIGQAGSKQAKVAE